MARKSENTGLCFEKFVLDAGSQHIEALVQTSSGNEITPRNCAHLTYYMIICWRQKVIILHNSREQNFE